MAAPARNPDLHGNAPDESPVVLLLIDVVNDLEFEGGERLLEHALPMARAIAGLRERAREAGVPVVYVNDNFGRWQSDFRRLFEHCLAEGVRGREVVRLLEPAEEDYFVLKPKHSGFYSTTLDTLLDYLGARTLVLAGMAADSCVLFTASDAFLRDFDLVVPPDCVASQTPERSRRALEQMEEVLHARLLPSEELDFRALKEEAAAG